MNDNFKALLVTNKNINRVFRDLIVWQEAIDLYSYVKKELRTLNDIPLKVKGQVEDSIFSVSSNIAEGYCRRSIKENIQFLSVALASLGENYSQIFACTNSEDLTVNWFNKYDSKHYSLENKLIKLNKTYISKLKDKDDWKNDYILREEIGAYDLD